MHADQVNGWIRLALRGHVHGELEIAWKTCEDLLEGLDLDKITGHTQ